MVRDQFWEEQYPELPYTAASEETKYVDPCLGSTAKVEVSNLKIHNRLGDLPLEVRDHYSSQSSGSHPINKIRHKISLYAGILAITSVM